MVNLEKVNGTQKLCVIRILEGNTMNIRKKEKIKKKAHEFGQNKGTWVGAMHTKLHKNHKTKIKMRVVCKKNFIKKIN